MDYQSKGKTAECTQYVVFFFVTYYSATVIVLKINKYLFPSGHVLTDISKSCTEILFTWPQ